MTDETTYKILKVIEEKSHPLPVGLCEKAAVPMPFLNHKMREYGKKNREEALLEVEIRVSESFRMNYVISHH